MFILFLIILVINDIYLFNHLDSLTIAQGYFLVYVEMFYFFLLNDILIELD